MARISFSNGLEADPGNPFVCHAWALMEQRDGNNERAREILEVGRVLLVAAADANVFGCFWLLILVLPLCVWTDVVVFVALWVVVFLLRCCRYYDAVPHSASTRWSARHRYMYIQRSVMRVKCSESR